MTELTHEQAIIPTKTGEEVSHGWDMMVRNAITHYLDWCYAIAI